MTDLLQNKTRIVSDVSVKLHSSELIFTLAADNIYFQETPIHQHVGRGVVCM